MLNDHLCFILNKLNLPNIGEIQSYNDSSATQPKNSLQNKDIFENKTNSFAFVKLALRGQKYATLESQP